MSNNQATSAPEDDSIAPLAGVKILDLSRVLAGPFASMILADLGAEVIKIEEIGRGDGTRTIPPFVNGESHYFLAINRNKQSVAVDMKKPEGRDLILKMAAHADVVLENFRAGVMDRLGLSVEALHKVNPRLVICSISGFGQTGPMRETASFDLVTQAMSGVMSINGEADGPPTKMGIPMGDVGGGMWAAIGILAALQKRNATGRGSRIDLSLLEGMMGLLGYLAELYLVTGESPGRVGSNHHSIVPYGRYPAMDGDLVIALHVGSFWRKFCGAVGREDMIEDPRFRTTAERQNNRAELERQVIEVLGTRTVKEWCEIFTKWDIPHGQVCTVGEAVEQEVIRERGLVRTVEHVRAGSVRLLGSPLLFDGFDASQYKPSPLLGEHTRSVLAGLGLSDADIDNLVRDEVVGQTDRPGAA
jgi:crotonobetainyl-CoA:carnitine CoA-transferase CaiB-like acyl-CoA transferase